MLQESQEIHVRVRRGMEDHGAEVLQCAQLDQVEAAVKGRPENTRVAQKIVRWKELVAWLSIDVLSTQAEPERCVHALEQLLQEQEVRPLQRLSCFYRLFLGHHDARLDYHAHVHDQFHL